jgi:hypothetical protein
MAEWDKFEISTSGKVNIDRIDGRKEKELDIIELSNKRYFVDKEYLRKLNEYSLKTLKDTPIYSLVGTNMNEENKGITIEIRELQKLNRLEEFIKDITENKEVLN